MKLGQVTPHAWERDRSPLRSFDLPAPDRRRLRGATPYFWRCPACGTTTVTMRGPKEKEYVPRPGSGDCGAALVHLVARL